MDTARIGKVIDDEYSARFTIANFQNGTLLPHGEEDLTCGIFRDADDKYVAAVASDQTVYTGQISRNDNMYNNFILTRHKKTGECQLIAVDTVSLSAVTNLKRKPVAITQKKTKLVQMSDLYKSFGSKRSKTMAEQSERLQFDVVNIKETLEQTAAVAEINEADLVSRPGENHSDYRPAINRSATQVADVYPLGELVPLDVLATAKDEADKYLEAEEGDIETCSFVKTEILKLQQSTAVDKSRKLQLLLYINCLVKHITTMARTINTKSYQPCPYSKQISDHIFKLFTMHSTTGRSRPMSMRDKCVCYVLVLSVIACDYELNLDSLAKDIKSGVKKLIDLSKVLSFTVAPKNTVKLQLPLPNPIVGRMARKRK